MKIFLFVLWVCALAATALNDPPQWFWTVLWGFTVPFCSFCAFLWYKFWRHIPGSDAGAARSSTESVQNAAERARSAE